MDWQTAAKHYVHCENNANCEMVTDTQAMQGSENDTHLSGDTDGKTPMLGNKVEITLAVRIFITVRY
jgi:hypothetical protein